MVENHQSGQPSDRQTNVRTEYAYDILGNRLAITNALGYAAAHTTYDALGRPVVVEDALGHQTRTQYNALGYRTVVTDANGAITHYSYDGLNRLVEVEYVGENTVRYTYNALGQRTAMTDTVGVTLYVYDDLGRLILVDDPLTGTVQYGYDLAGNRTQLIYPSGQTVTYTYDADNRLTRVADWDGGITSYSYDAAGQLITTTLPNGVVSVNAYDDAGRLVGLTHTTPSHVVLSGYAYELDGVGNRVSTVETLTSTTRTIAYVYDPLNRLTGSDYSTGEQFVYTYNAVGNRAVVTETTPISGTVVTTYTFDAASRLTDRAMSNGWTYTYTWSARGQMLAEWTQGQPVRTFEYDAAGQMSEATVFTLTTHFRYNGDGARVAVEVVGQGTTTYTIDYAGGYRILAETALAETVSYLYGHDCLGEQRDDEWLYYLNDAAGYVRQGTDEQGQVESHWLFDPDGLVLFGPQGPVSHLVCSGVYDWSTGLIFKGGRYFDPTLGLWLSLAPLVLLQGCKECKKRRWWQRWVVMLVILAGVSGMLVGCMPSTTQQSVETQICSTITTPTHTIQPLFCIVVVRLPHIVKGVQVEYAVQWKVPDSTKKGFIVQHIKKEVSVTDSLGNPILDPDYDNIEFWEAWEVTEGGDIWIGAAHEKRNGIKCSTDADCDSYTSFDYGKGTKGTWKVIGRVKFLEDYKIEPYKDDKWKPGIRVKSLYMYGPLLFSTTQPDGWSDAGALEHNLTVEWDWTRQPYDIMFKAYP